MREGMPKTRRLCVVLLPHINHQKLFGPQYQLLRLQTHCGSVGSVLHTNG